MHPQQQRHASAVRLPRRRLLATLGLLGTGAALGACGDLWSVVARASPAKPGGSPFTIEALRARTYAPSEIRLRQVMGRERDYTSYLMTHESDGLQLTGVATIPKGSGPFPVVVLNHGFTLPSLYDTGDGTRAMSDALARRGFLALAPDYRGLGSSENDGHLNFGARLDFAIDVLNLIAALPSVPEARTDRVGAWGHSLGCDVSLRAAEVNPVIGPLALWAPLSAWMDDMADYYFLPTTDDSAELRAALSPGNYLRYLSGPVTIHQGEADRAVKPSWARKLHEALEEAGVPSELTMHPGLGHFLDFEAQVIVQSTADFFERHLGA